jgi:hypothetical protein
MTRRNSLLESGALICGRAVSFVAAAGVATGLWRGGLTVQSIAGLIGMAGLFFVTAAGAEPLTLGIRDVHVDRDRVNGALVVSITLMDSSKAAFARFSQDNVGHRMELRLDGKQLVTTVLREPILGGSFQISDVADAAVVAEQLSKGKGTVQVERLPD